MSTQVQINASQQFMRSVRMAQARATAAELAFDSAGTDIERQTRLLAMSRSNQVIQVGEIALAARKACDTLYLTYQSLVKQLDAECRPMLAIGIHRDAINSVRDAIRHFNDE